MSTDLLRAAKRGVGLAAESAALVVSGVATIAFYAGIVSLAACALLVRRREVSDVD